MGVPPRRRGLGRLARHRARARRHDDGRTRMAGRDLGVEASRSYAPSPVKDATGPSIRSSRGPVREPSSASLPVSSDATIRPVSASVARWSLLQACAARCRASRPATRRARTAAVPCCPPAGARARAGARPRHRQRPGPAAERAVVGHGEVEAEQGDDGGDEAFRLAQRQAEHRPQGQRRGDRQAGVAWLSAAAGAGLGAPSFDRLRREPYGQAAARPQAGLVGRPVGDPVLLLRDAAPAVLVGFGW